MTEGIRFPFEDDPDEPLIYRYQRALGRFIHDFTMLEVVLFRLLCEVAGVAESIGFALFSGSRADALLSQIRRCYRARQWEIPAHVESALGQAAAINKVRSMVVHFVTVTVEDDEDQVLALSGLRYAPENAKEVRFAPKTLDDMGRDCRIMCAHLIVEAEEIREPGCTSATASEMARPPTAWHYKQPPQDTPPRKESPGRKAQAAQAKRSPRQKSSPE